MAAVLDLAGLAQAHEAVAGAASAVAGGAEAWDVAHAHEPLHDFIQRAVVADIELGGVFFFWFWLYIAANAGAGSAADLADADVQRTRADFLVLAGGDDHAGVWHSDADAGDDLDEGIVVDAVVEFVWIDVVGVFHAWHADGVWADAVDGFQMFGVHQQAGEFVAIELKPEEHAQANVVDAAFHGAVHRFGVPCVVVLWPGWMELLVAFLVVGFLEEDVGTDASVLEHLVFFNSRGSDVDVDTTNHAIVMGGIINGVDAFEDILDRIVHRIFACFDGQTLVTHVFQGAHFGSDFFLGQLLAGDVLVLGVVWAVNAAIDAVVGQVQRREHDDAVAVEVLLDLLSQRHDLGVFLRIVAGQEHGSFSVGQALAQLGLFEDLIDEGEIVFVGVGISQRIQDFLMVDEFFCFQ